MNEVFRGLAAISFCISILVAIPAWFASLYYLFRTVGSSFQGSAIWRPEPGFLGFLRWQPFNVIFDGSQITPEGIVYRRRLVVATLLFTIPTLLTLALAALGGALDS